MRILVLNGSPKGEMSITLQTVRYLEKLHPEHTFTVLHVGQKIKVLEKDFSPVAEAVTKADLLLFSYPVYTFIAPYQLHRTIELMKLHSVSTEGKFAAQITTSKHFYDVTAHAYITDNCHDLGLRYVGGLSADMEDLTTEKGRTEAEAFWQRLIWNIERGCSEPYYEVTASYSQSIASAAANVPKQTAGEVVIVSDGSDNPSLTAMIERFRSVLPIKTRVVDLAAYPFKGGCLGCFHCAADGICVYKDGFDTFLREQIQTVNAIVYAFTIRDHSMGPRMKLYDDRQFCNGHRTVTIGMPFGYLVSGNLGAEVNLRTVIEARAQVGGNILAGIATDNESTDMQIDRLADSLVYSLDKRPNQPQNFYGIGGMKIFRDLIYQMRGMMKADHKFYKAHGQYDFPQKQKGKILLMYLVGALNASPKLRSKMGGKMNEGMLMPYKKVLDDMDKEKK